MEHIGEILRTAREDNFYTQKKVIELTGINRKTLSGYENSVAEPDLDICQITPLISTFCG